MVLRSDANKLIDRAENHHTEQTLLDKYRIPVQHFEYSYIETCKDGRELEKIVQVLRTGEEGYFPDLTRFAEHRLSVVKPKSKLLKKACPVISKDALNKEEKNQLTNDLTQWITDVSKDDEELTFFKNRKSAHDSLPEVREINENVVDEKKKSVKRISSTDYSSWDKYDPDTEILKMDLEEENMKKAAAERSKKKSTAKKTVQFRESTSDVEALQKANYEKQKGNESFKTSDYKEALKHYTNSINCKPTLASFTNRALTQIKLKKFKNAIDDCHSALAIEPDNVKAILRKAQALDCLGRQGEALECVEQAIEIHPNNTLAQELAEKFRKLCGAIPKGVTRFVIKDVEANHDKKNIKEDTDNDKDEVIIPIPGTSNMSPPHYITCSDDNPEKVKEETIRANTPKQIVHLINVDTSDAEDDDSCTVNHLRGICTRAQIIIKTSNSQEPQKENTQNSEKTMLLKKQVREILQIPNNTEGNEFKKEVKKNYSSVDPKTSTGILNDDRKTGIDVTVKAAVDVFKEDQRAGGEPCVKYNECIDLPCDIHSPYSFLKTWNSANHDSSLEQHASILRRVDMKRIVEVVGCKLDNAMFSTMIKCLSIHFAVPGQVEKLHVILENIVNLPRFDIISLLMSAEDRNSITSLVNFLKQHDKPLPKNVINKFFNNYILPDVTRRSDPTWRTNTPSITLVTHSLSPRRTAVSWTNHFLAIKTHQSLLTHTLSPDTLTRRLTVVITV